MTANSLFPRVRGVRVNSDFFGSGFPPLVLTHSETGLFLNCPVEVAMVLFQIHLLCKSEKSCIHGILTYIAPPKSLVLSLSGHNHCPSLHKDQDETIRAAQDPKGKAAFFSDQIVVAIPDILYRGSHFISLLRLLYPCI